MADADNRAPSQTLRLAELLASVSLTSGHRERSASRPRVAHLHDRRRPRRGDGMRSGRGPNRPPVRAPPIRGLHGRCGGDRRDGRWRRPRVQRRDGSGPHGLGSGDDGTVRAERRPRPAPVQRLRLVARALADPKGTERSLSTHCEVAVMLAGRSWPWEAGHRSPRPRLRALGREGLADQARGRGDPARGARRRGRGGTPISRGRGDDAA